MSLRSMLLALIVTSSCASTGPTTPSPATTAAPALDQAPPDLPPAGLRPLMWQLTAHVRALYAGFSDDRPQRQPEQAQVLERLAAMRGVAVDLSLLPERRKHPVLDEGVLAFAGELETAWKAAQQVPPDYTLARNVTGSCLACHTLRPCPFDRYDQCVNAPIY